MTNTDRYSEREAAANVALDGGTRPEMDAAAAFHQMFERWLEEDANPAGLMKVRELCRTAFIEGWEMRGK